MKKLESNEYATILRTDFYSFTERAFRELNPDTDFVHGWHNELVAAHLSAVFSGDLTRLSINMPPRSLKSHTASVTLPAFILGHNPSAQVICVSYSEELANKHSRDCFRLMSSRFYRGLFRTRLSPQRQAVQEFVTTAGGFRMATSVGGTLTGRGGDFMIIDDPLKPDQALSETLRKAANEWFENTLYSRLNDKRSGRIVIIMQRLHPDDLVGHVLEQEPWTVLSLAAIADEDERYEVNTPYGRRIVGRKAGEALHPEREPLEVLAQIRKTVGEYNFSAQYQQQPIPPGGGMVKLAWLKSFGVAEHPTTFDLVIQSWDTACKATDIANYSVCTTWGVKGNLYYLLDVYRKRLEYPDLKRAVGSKSRQFRPSHILIEDRASGTQLLQELRRDGILGLTSRVPEQDKIMRMFAVTSIIESGLVYLPHQAEWLQDYLAELTSFPHSKYSDQVDSTSQALHWLNSCAPRGSATMIVGVPRPASMFSGQERGEPMEFWAERHWSLN